MIEKVLAEPAQLFENGVTVNNAETGTADGLVAVKEAILPVPDNALIPTAVVVLVQI